MTKAKVSVLNNCFSFLECQKHYRRYNKVDGFIVNFFS